MAMVSQGWAHVFHAAQFQERMRMSEGDFGVTASGISFRRPYTPWLRGYIQRYRMRILAIDLRMSK
jgi:hypothetical protein